MPEKLLVPKVKFNGGTLRIPGSKSLTNRALMIAALAKGQSRLTGYLDSDDTKYMVQALKQLGVAIQYDGDQLKIIGCAGTLQAVSDEIYIENAGTAARFLTAALTLGQGRYILTGNRRMQERPMFDLISALNSIGANVVEQQTKGCLPIAIKATGFSGGDIAIDGRRSSQFVSALMMVAPFGKSDTKINIKHSLVSRSYVEMTAEVMKEFGVSCEFGPNHQIYIANEQVYRARSYHIEGDGSSASYFFALAAICKSHITIYGLTRTSTQGDLGFVDILAQMGCVVDRADDHISLRYGDLRAVEVDMNTMSDVAMTLAVVAIFAKGTTKIFNVGNMRLKECDRIRAIVTELRKLNVEVREWDDGFSVKGVGDQIEALTACEFDTYDDHRMAMALTLIGLRIDGIVVNNPACVSKTFPRYFDYLFKLLGADINKI